VVAERLVVGLPDGTDLLGPHVADLEPIGQWRVRDVVERRAAHREPVAHLGVALRQEELASPALVAGPATEHPAVGVLVALGRETAAPLVMPEQPPADPPPAHLRRHRAERRVHRHAVPDLPVDVRRRYRPPIELGDEDVALEDEVFGVLELGLHVGGVGQPVVTVVEVGASGEVGHDLVVRGVAERPQVQARDGRRPGEFQLIGRHVHRHPPGWSGLRHAVSLDTMRKPHDSYRVIAWFGFSASTPR
jgi:hypothetical protein